MASLKPSPSAPSRFAAGTLHAEKRSVAIGCGATISMRSSMESPGASASTTKAEMPFVPASSPVRAKTM